jgi:hypothetical protein
VQSPSATNKRGDWLVLSATSSPPVVAAPSVAMPAPAPLVAAPVGPLAPAPMAAPPAPAAVVVAPVAPSAPVADDAEQRLLKLKHLYDKGLITKSEYEKKREEIIKSL